MAAVAVAMISNESRPCVRDDRRLAHGHSRRETIERHTSAIQITCYTRTENVLMRARLERVAERNGLPFSLVENPR